jgi:DNA-binding transcriptional regulator YiaG
LNVDFKLPILLTVWVGMAQCGSLHTGRLLDQLMEECHAIYVSVTGGTIMKASDKIDARAIRRKLGVNQQTFWSKLGVTQSGGSRYESGRAMPRPVQHLLRLVHVEQLDIAKVRREDFEVISYLKANNPALLKELKALAKASQKV